MWRDNCLPLFHPIIFCFRIIIIIYYMGPNTGRLKDEQNEWRATDANA